MTPRVQARRRRTFRTPSRRRAPGSKQSGFSIVEALVSVVLFSFAVIGTAGLQSALIGYAQNSEYRAEAAFYAEQIVGLATVDVANAACYAGSTCGNPDAAAAAQTWLDDVQAALPGAADLAPEVTYTASSGDFSVTVYWRRPGDDTTRNVTLVTVVR